MPKFYNPNNFSMIPVGTMNKDSSIDGGRNITIPDNASGIFMQAFGDPVYFRVDGQSASATTGFALSQNDGVVRLDLHPGAVINVESTSSGEIQWQFFKQGGGAI